MSVDTIKRYTGDEDFDELLDKCLRIMKTKAIDYAEEDDRLAELRATAAEIGVSMKQVLGVYMNKHLRSVFKWLRGEELKGEPVEDKLMDIIVYCLLAYKLVKESRRGLKTDTYVTSVPVVPKRNMDLEDEAHARKNKTQSSCNVAGCPCENTLCTVEVQQPATGSLSFLSCHCPSCRSES